MSSDVDKTIAIHQVRLENIEKRLARLEEIYQDVAELKVQFEAMQQELRQLRLEMQKRNGIYKWLTTALITISAGFLTVIVTLIGVLLNAKVP